VKVGFIHEKCSVGINFIHSIQLWSCAVFLIKFTFFRKKKPQLIHAVIRQQKTKNVTYNYWVSHFCYGVKFAISLILTQKQQKYNTAEKIALYTVFKCINLYIQKFTQIQPWSFVTLCHNISVVTFQPLLLPVVSEMW